MLTYKTNRRLNYVSLSEQITVGRTFPYTAPLKEVPDLASNITITGLVRVYVVPRNANEFYVSRTGEVYFHSSKAGYVYTVDYFGGGSRIVAEDWNEMLDTLTSTNNLIQGLKSIVFGDIKLVVSPVQISTSAANLNTSNAGTYKVTFTLTLNTISTNTTYAWLQNIPLYVDIIESIVDPDVPAPTVNTPSGGYQFVNGVCTVVATYFTDYGAYKKYAVGDYINYVFSTVDTTTMIGLNLTKNVTDTIQI